MQTPKTESVLISVSVVVAAPVSDSLPDDAALDPVREAFLEAVGARLQASVAALRGEPWLEEEAGVYFHYLSPDSDNPEPNAARCAGCGRWTSDYYAPDFLELLHLGKVVDGQLRCDECRGFFDAPVTDATPP